MYSKLYFTVWSGNKRAQHQSYEILTVDWLIFAYHQVSCILVLFMSITNLQTIISVGKKKEKGALGLAYLQKF
jgi:hypothetical protein